MNKNTKSKAMLMAPEVRIYTLYRKMLQGGHLLIAGAQGSGKSCLMESLLVTALCGIPGNQTAVVLIDPKRGDYQRFRCFPHVVGYATERREIIDTMSGVIRVMNERLDYMVNKGIREYDGPTLFVFIDELADLMTDKPFKKRFSPLLQRVAQMGRAAGITIIAGTQCCLASVIDTAIKCNFASRVAMRTATAQDSRNVIEQKGAELLPNPRTEGRADCIWRNGMEVTIWQNLPRYTDDFVAQLKEWWTTDACKYIEPAPEAPQGAQEAPTKRRGLLERLFGKAA